MNEPWLVTPHDVLAGRFVADAFAARGLKPPRPVVATYSTYLRSSLASRGHYIAVLPRSVLQLNAKLYSLKTLPIRLSAKPSPVAIVTLRNRTLTPTMQAFVECARQIANSHFSRTEGAKAKSIAAARR